MQAKLNTPHRGSKPAAETNPYLTGAVRGATTARVARAVSARAASFCGSLPPGCTIPADMISVIAASTVMIEIDDVAARHIEKEAGGRIGRAGHEGSNVLAVGKRGSQSRCSPSWTERPATTFQEKETQQGRPGGSSTAFANTVSKICFRLL